MITDAIRHWACRFRRTRARTLLLAVVCSSVYGETAACADEPAFEILPDGRLSMRIFDQRVVVPANLVAHTIMLVGGPGCGKFDQLPLSKMVENPSAAECVHGFLNRAKSVMIYFNTGGPDDREFLKSLQRWELLGSGTYQQISLAIWKPGEDPRNQPPGIDPRRRPNGTPARTEGKFLVFPGVPLPKSNPLHGTAYDPNGVEYILPADDRLRPAAISFDIACRWTGAPSRECGASITSEDRRVLIGVSWLEAWSARDRWPEYDLLLRDLAKSIFVDYPAEDLQ